MAEEIDRGVTCESLENARSFIFELAKYGDIPILRGVDTVSSLDDLLEAKGCISFEDLRRRRAEVSEELMGRIFKRSPMGAYGQREEKLIVERTSPRTGRCEKCGEIKTLRWVAYDREGFPHYYCDECAEAITPYSSTLGHEEAGIMRCRYCGAPYLYRENLELHEKSCPRGAEL